jgi:hypothetical protein
MTAALAPFALNGCQECGGAEICGSAPDAFYECPTCTGIAVDLDDTQDDRFYATPTHPHEEH